jgi:hypothetical protein
MCEVARKLVGTPLSSFQDLKLSTKDIIIVLKDTLNITLGLLLIPDPHVTGVPSNTLERHLISSHVVDGIRNLVTSFSMAKLVGFPTFDSTFTYNKGVNTTRNFGFCNYHLQLKLLHATHANVELCSCIRQVAHDIQWHVTLRMQHVYMVFICMLIHTY